jgi:hypothetical protein
MHHAFIDSTSDEETQEAKFVPVLRGIQFIAPDCTSCVPNVLPRNL